MKTIVALLVVLALAGCARKSQEVSSTTNPEFKAELLFTHDGCVVYRFYDAGYPRYYARCRDGWTPQTMWGEPRSSGKGGTTMRPDGMITLVAKPQH